ncbi:PI-PLC X domain-containing protein 3 [Prorops nasuta]|uniref:PI-PLC X domain-containing protein 3 n=1 Tax=Prorops nasuta TaxID=863751 RepID=UPI0034CFD9AF
MEDVTANNIFDGCLIKESNNLESWMSLLSPSLKKLPIIQLAIPGSHNSMTYTIMPENDIGPDEPAYIRMLGCICTFAAKPIIFNWSITQDSTIIQQLNGGVRYLDLRVATKSASNDFYFLHGLYGEKINKSLEDILNWLNHHPNEIIILDFQHFYSFSHYDHEKLIKLITNMFHGKLCPVYETFNHITLEWLSSLKNQIILIYRDINARNHAYFWPNNFWPTPWPNTTSTDRLIAFLSNNLRSKNDNLGFVSQCLLTPNFPYVLKHLCGNLRKSLVRSCQTPIYTWINEQCPGKFGMNIVIAGFYIGKELFILQKYY